MGLGGVALGLVGLLVYGVWSWSRDGGAGPTVTPEGQTATQPEQPPPSTGGPGEIIPDVLPTEVKTETAPETTPPAPVVGKEAPSKEKPEATDPARADPEWQPTPQTPREPPTAAPSKAAPQAMLRVGRSDGASLRLKGTDSFLTAEVPVPVSPGQVIIEYKFADTSWLPAMRQVNDRETWTINCSSAQAICQFVKPDGGASP